MHRAERTGPLADGLGRLLAQPLPDPFEQELVIVPTRGVERWLTQRLSHHLGTSQGRDDGVCAGVRFLAPHSLVALLTGRDRDDPWHPDRLVWPLLEVIDASLDEPWCATLAAHLGHHSAGPDAEHRSGRRYAVARRIAGLFASYATQRPTLLVDWRAGRMTDGCGGDLDPDLSWQAHLWCRLLDQVDQPAPDERHSAALVTLRSGQDPTPRGELPSRLSMFGHTRLPASELEILAALGEQRDVHLWLPQPSAVLWARLHEAGARGVIPRADDRSAALARHPLLASLGRDARELQRTLPDAEDVTTASADPSAPTTVLQRLQTDLRGNRAPDAAERAARAVSPDDRSVQVHACHGPARQVEVLREVLTGLLQDDATLEPRDILVMCPDVEAYTPLFQAAFGLAAAGDGGPGAGHPAHQLRVKLADRAPAATNSLLEIATALVDFTSGRVTASEVRSLIAVEPVRRRFRFDDDELERIATWVQEAEIRWGLDADHRSRFALQHVAQNTWRFGLDRMLLGVTTDSEHGTTPGDTLPLDDVASGDIDLVGRFAELIDRLAACVAALDAASTVREWTTALVEGVTALAEVSRENAWQQAQFEGELATVQELAAADATLRLSDIRHLLRTQLRSRATRSNFRTGTLTVCTMMPMRSVPHRVIALVGLDDGAFPRLGAVDGDDVLARRPLTGERDVRSEDRQLLLDAVLAAQDHLVVTYSGAGEHTGAPKPPAAPLGELIDAVRATATFPADRAVVTRHPLQPFDPRNLTPGALGSPHAFSFDRHALAGARAARGERTERGPLLTAQLPKVPGDQLELADLLGFFADPARHFVRRRLDVALPFEQDEPGDAMPIELDGLGKWQIGDRALRESLAGATPDAVARMEQLRGAIPPGELGRGIVSEVIDSVRQVREKALPLLQQDATSLDVDLLLPDGRRLTGTITDLHGDRVVAVTYSTLRAKQRLASWIQLVTLAAAVPDRPWQAATAGFVKPSYRPKVPGGYLAGPLDQQAAMTILMQLVDVYDRGMRTPIPLPLRTSLAYAEKLRRSPDKTVTAASAARRDWESSGFGDRRIAGEQEDEAQVLIRGGVIDFAALQAERPLPEEAWNAATSRLGQYALRVWSPPLEAQRVVT
nr:exodeoxyribonuclease V subunit gamma [Flexivirga meconopsidis]